ncbi:MAG: hypothetical protein VYE09_01190 [Pseudomonadota bacterium]|nr:hypothetical protein [Pseudomonadota bacterium]
MLKKITFAVLFIIFGIYVYFVFIFDINNYKSELEDIVSEKSKTEFRISGDLELDIGTNTIIKAELLSVRKSGVLILESDIFTTEVSFSQVLQGNFDINSVSLIDSKLYGINVDETIIQTYSLISGKRYSIKNKSYSNIKSIDARGKYSDGMLQIDDIRIRTELLQADGFGKIIPDSELLSISAMSTIANDTVTKEKFGEYYPIYLENTELPILISGNFKNPEIDVKISDVISKKIQQEIKNKAIDSIKDKIKDKIQSDINIKLPF